MLTCQIRRKGQNTLGCTARGLPLFAGQPPKPVLRALRLCALLWPQSDKLPAMSGAAPAAGAAAPAHSANGLPEPFVSPEYKANLPGKMTADAPAAAAANPAEAASTGASAAAAATSAVEAAKGALASFGMSKPAAELAGKMSALEDTAASHPAKPAAEPAPAQQQQLAGKMTADAAAAAATAAAAAAEVSHAGTHGRRGRPAAPPCLAAAARCKWGPGQTACKPPVRGVHGR